MSLRARKSATGSYRPDDDYLIDIPRVSQREIALNGPLDWSLIFGKQAPLRVEIGFGKSEFLIDLAERESEYNYVGFEYSTKRVGVFLRKVRRRGVQNIRVLRENATPILPLLFDHQTINHFYILFPDPWPKKRHAKHRLIQDKNIDVFGDLLEPRGGLSLRTDAPHYARQMLDTLDANPQFENLAGEGAYALRPRDAIPTLYQTKFAKAGRSIYYLEYEKRQERGNDGRDDTGGGLGQKEAP